MKLLRLTVITALRALGRNKMRSALTILGIVIGVAAVITMVALGQGASLAVQEQIRGLGNNLLMVIPGATTEAGVRSGWGGVSTLTVQDAEAIERDCDAVAAVAHVRREVVQIIYGNDNWSTVAQGSTPSYERVTETPVVAGRFLTDRDERSAARVLVLGQTIVDELFGEGEDPIGAVVRIAQVPFRVVGVLKAKGQTTWGRDQDDVIVMPFSTAERRVMGTVQPGRVDFILASARTEASVVEASDQIDALLRERHRTRPGEEADFTVRNLKDIAERAERTTNVMTTVLLAVSSISLLVGGIGIMNILLVSVTERTREIGIRMAVGAKARHILLQFLVESIVLSVIGGLAGIVLGLIATQALSHIGGWPALVSPLVVAGAVLFAGTVGVFFGFYPARKASHLEPIAALRYE
jgi:putative ABC transport system permease protein